MYNKIIESLHEISDDNIQKQYGQFSNNEKQRKSNSFTELSDWNSKNRYKFNHSIVLPKIGEEREGSPYGIIRKVQSQLGNYPKRSKGQIKSVDLRNRQRESLYKKNSLINVNEYFLKKEERIGRQHEVLKSNVDIAKQSIINRVMLRKNKLKKKLFYEQYFKGERLK